MENPAFTSNNEPVANKANNLDKQFARTDKSGSIYDPYRQYNKTLKLSGSSTINKEYLKSIVGWLRICVILFNVGTIVTIICVYAATNDLNEVALYYLKIVFLILSILAFMINVTLFLLILFSVIYSSTLVRVNWKFILLFNDVLFAFVFAVLSILCVIEATSKRKSRAQDSFIATAVLGLVTSIFYLISAFFVNCIHLLSSIIK